MRLKGRKIEGLNVEEIIIPRGDGEPLVFKAQAVIDYDVFDKLVPEPKPKRGRNRKGDIIELREEDSFKSQLDMYGEKKFAYMLLKSLEATADLEWETVNIDNPDTWLNYKDELKAAGISTPEFGRIIRGVTAACGLDEAKVEAARNRFLAGRQEALELQSSLRDDLNSTLSGEPVSDSE